MQPSESATGSMPVMGGGPVPGPGGKGPNRRLRLWLALGAGILALFCLGGVGVFVSLYDEATEIKRAAPDAVVDSYLGAYLVDRDDKSATLYTCRSGGDLSSVVALREQMVRREKDFGVKVRVTWEALAVSGAIEGSRTVSTNLIIAGYSSGDVQSRRDESWTFGLVEDGGWRVCSASKVP